MTRCASRISSNLKILVGLTSSRPAASSAAICCRGTSESGKVGRTQKGRQETLMSYTVIFTPESEAQLTELYR
jgi:hypothetical protein